MSGSTTTPISGNTIGPTNLYRIGSETMLENPRQTTKWYWNKEQRAEMGSEELVKPWWTKGFQPLKGGY